MTNSAVESPDKNNAYKRVQCGRREVGFRKPLWTIALSVAMVLVNLTVCGEVSESTAAKINATISKFNLEKQNRSKVQTKIDSALLERQDGLGTVLSRMGQEETNADDVVECEITGAISDRLVELIEGHGGVVTFKSVKYGSLSCRLPVSAIESIAADKDVRRIKRIHGSLLNKSNTSQGDTAHKAQQARSTFNVSGKGVKVGVISDSARYASEMQATGDLPYTLTVLPGYEGVRYDGGERVDTGEGSGMMEIVYDLAPDAGLYFATGSGTIPQFAAAVDELSAAGCRIIVDDVSKFNESALQDSVIVDAINRFTENGGIYFSSAANSGNLTAGTSGTWEGDFSASTHSSGSISGTFHSFGQSSNVYLNELTQAGSAIILQWADPWGASSNDYDLYAFDSNGNVLAKSTDTQDGSGDPFEIIYTSGVNMRVYIAVVKYSGEGRYLRIDTARGRLQYATAGSTYGHNAADRAFSVAAAAAPTGRAFVSTDSLESYSSDGPRKVFFNHNGVKIGASGYLSTGGVTLNKPDITAADATLSRWTALAYGESSFGGTSAAAPHAAAIVALMLEANPSLTRDDVFSILTNTTFSKPSWNRNKGYGIIDAYAAVEAAQEYKGATPRIPEAPTVEISKTSLLTRTMSWNAVPGAKYYKVYRSTNPFADPEAVSGWQTERTFRVEKPSAEGTCYFYFVKAASAQDDATAGPFNEVKVVTGDSAYTYLQYSTNRNYVAYNDDTEFHLYGSSAVSDTPYKNQIVASGMTPWRIWMTGISSDKMITATINGVAISAEPTFSNFMSRCTLNISAPENTTQSPRYCSFCSTAREKADGFDSDTYAKTWMFWPARPHYIYQAGVDAFSVDTPTSLEVGKGCSTNRVAITATPTTTAWTATTDSPDWITLYRTSSTGSGVLCYIVAENPNDEAREGHITLIGASTKKVLTVRQMGTKLLPDLYPYKPSGWSAPVVATTSSSSTTTPSSFSTSDAIYVRWAVGCKDQDVNAPFKTCLYVDGALSKTYSTSELSAGKYTYNSPAYSLGKLSAGTHQIKIVTDKENAIRESNESNNEYLISIDVQQPVTLTSLTIEGESSVYSGSKTTYTCKAYYSDGASEMVSPSWSIYSGSSYASIDSETGVLTAKTVSSQQSVTIRATYGGVSKNKVITIKPSIAMSTAVDNTVLSFVTGSASPWFGQTTTTHDGVDALQSGDVEDDEESWVQTSVTGAGEISFWWYVESEQSCDLLEFLIDGEVKGAISGTNNSWGQKRFVISGSGSHTLQWRYSKDEGASRGLDAGFIDQVVWTPSAPVAQDKPDIGFMSFASLTYKKGYVYMSDVWSNDAIRVCTKGVQYLANYGFGNWGAGDAVGTITNQIEVYDDRAKLISANAVSKSINLPSRRGYSNNSRAYSEWKNLPSGAYMLMVRLDVGGCFDEEDETNNSGAYWFAVRDPTSLDEALDNETLVFDTDAKNGWFGTKGIGADGVDAAQSTHLGHSSTNKLSTTVSGPGTFAFKWKVSSEKNQDRLQFLIDGSVKCEISGIDGGWESRSFDIPDGVHAVEWRYAKDKQYSVGGDCGWVDQVVWTSGVGGEFEIKDGVLTRYYGSSSHVMIPSGVQHIGEHVFYGHDEIESLTIPSNVKSIGNYAFDDCTGLTRLEIAEGVVTIGDSAFAYCDALTSVELPKTVTNIGDFAFQGCSRLQTLVLNEGLSAIGAWAFNGCSEIVSVTIPSTVDSIGKLAFANCSSLTTLIIREGVASLGEGMVFGYCTGLTSVVLPASIVDAGWATFSYCSSLVKLTFYGLPPDDLLNSVLLNSALPLIRYNKAYEAEWLIAFSNCGYSRYEAFLPETMPTVEGDDGATVTGDAETGFVIKPSEGKTAVEVTIPEGVDAAKVTVEVSPKVTSVKPNGAKVKVVSGSADITEFLNVPAADGDGVVDLTKATVKAEIVKEAMDVEKGAEIKLDAANPLLTTPNTRVGLFYQLREGETLGGMKDGDSTVGDGQPWTPEIKVKGGNSAFYSIGVGKGK